ncbi:response regulator [Legionella saoudiensis]|uniref:response regulator n=1 Tax=Legionella saoudiensis TaxID=1750561 RepID=UPI0009902F2E|nr:response regulator [Legionella saoudiensis]
MPHDPAIKKLLQRVKELELAIKVQQNKISQLDSENFQLKNLIDNLPGDIYWKDKNGIWSGVNKRGAQSLNQMGFITDRSEVIGKSDYQLFSKETADEYRKNDLEVMSKKIEITREEINKLPNGETMVQLSAKRPLWDKEGNVVGVVGNTIDISYLKKIEAELKTAIEKSEIANKAKTEFLENMRHDIRTPLTGIVGFADILKLESDNAQIKEYAENLVASSHALLDLLDEVLEAIRVSSGEIPKLKKKFDLKKSLEQIINLNRAKAAQKKLELTLNFDPSIPEHLIGDKIRIHRVVLELIANALNFTNNGFVRLNAELAKRNNRELIIKLIVEDSGIGVPLERQQEIYVQFTRLTPSYQGIYKGAGLGLSVVKQFIDELGGEIYLESEPRKGSKFTCIIPLQEPLLNDDLGLDEEFEPLKKPSYTEELKRPYSDLNTNKFRVLVVEDNPIAQTVAKSILGKLNCHTDIAESGRRAVALWKSRSYDLIFMDIGLPDLDGYEVTHQIRVHELPRKTHTPIIALTAHVGDENKKRCIEAGMNAVLTKPLTLKNCSDILDAFIPGHQKKEDESQTTQYLTDLPDSMEHLFNLTEFPLLDIEEGIKTTGNQSILAEMLNLLIHDSLPKDLQLMEEAHQVQDWETTQQLAHKIKGGAIYVGTVKMKIACQYLERYWKTGHSELLEELYQQAVTVIRESIKEVAHWLNGH